MEYDQTAARSIRISWASARAKDGPSVELSIGFRAQVGKEIMASAPLSFCPQCGQIDGTNHDLFAGAGICLGQDAAVEIDDHATAGP